MITANEIHYAAGSREILRGVDFQVTEGEFVGLIGPNGSGKSTFLKNLYKVLRPQRGAITLCGEDLLSMSNREMARRIAVMVQEQEAAFVFTVEEVVMMGRQARKRLLETDSREDWALVGEILDLTGLSPLRKQGFITLSGGEKQRVLIARALAGNPQILLLDDCSSALDYKTDAENMMKFKTFGCYELAAVKLDSSFPEYLVKNKDKYKHLLTKETNKTLFWDCIIKMGLINLFKSKENKIR